MNCSFISAPLLRYVLECHNNTYVTSIFSNLLIRTTEKVSSLHKLKFYLLFVRTRNLVFHIKGTEQPESALEHSPEEEISGD